jgi:hypothetical protein
MKRLGQAIRILREKGPEALIGLGAHYAVKRGRFLSHRLGRLIRRRQAGPPVDLLARYWEAGDVAVFAALWSLSGGSGPLVVLTPTYLVEPFEQAATRTLFLDGENSGGHSLLAFGRGGPTAMVQTVAFADLLEAIARPVDILKIDAEGSEYDMLFPAADLLRQRVDHIVMEAHASGRRRPAELVRLLGDLGYAVRTEGSDRLMLIFADRA